MGKKRKRPVKGKRAQAHSSQTRITAASTDFRDQSGFASDRATEITHPVISLYYNEVVTLRQFLLRQIPAASRSRRRRIASIRADLSEGADKLSLSSQCGLATLLDSTLVGIPQDSAIACDQERGQELAALRKSQPHSQLDSTDTGPPCAQAELVDRAIQLIWKPFLSETKKRPHHLLTRGFRNPFETFFPNENVQKLKSSPWTEVLGLVGSNGEIIMLRLLCDCGIFVALDSRKGIYHQICGQSLEKLEPIFNKPQHLSLKPTRTRSEGKSSVIADGQQEKKVGSHSDQQPQRRTPNSIFFNRYRMLYAFPKKANNWKSQPGLGSHVLNRCPYPKSQWRAIHVMQHIFPSQFGLTNVFNPDPENDSKYLSREDEIAARSRKRRWIASNCVHQDTNDEVPLADIPKRLRGQALDLVQQILHRHKRCQYRYLLDYYCSPANVGPWKFGAYDSQSSFQSNPVGSAKLITQLEGPGKQALHADAAVSEAQKTSCSIPRPTVDTVNLVSEPAVVSKPSLTYYATPASSVSAYCQAVIRKLIPPQFYGTGQNGINNQSVILKNVDEFIRMRRFENLSLQEVCKGVKISCISWLGPGAGRHQLPADRSHPKLSLSDLQKRTELLHEFIYYLFESILIPLVRAAFYVTESQCHRNRLFYFRHDVWRTLTEKPLAEMQANMFEELMPEIAQKVLRQRTLGYGSLRLLPKATGIRPIVNLKRRMPSTKSTVNSTVSPIHSVLNYERMHHPAQMGSCLHSVGELHSRLKVFKKSLLARQPEAVVSPSLPRLYLVKLDIQSCFDSIPQESMVQLIDKLVSAEAYHITKYVEMKPAEDFNNTWPLHQQRQSRAWKRWVGRAAPTSNPQHLEKLVSRGGTSQRRNTVFVDTFWHSEKQTYDLLDLLEEHVRNNLVKFGERYFRQRSGIPQGSVISSLLCNLFYADMEREVLNFLQPDETLLLRLIDDFLLITTDLAQAKRFLLVMIRGLPAYGISVNPAKSLVNFSIKVDGAHIPRIVDARLFPYCGSLIDFRTLELHKDHDRILDGGESAAASLANSLTVDSTRTPARSLHRKTLTSFKALMHPMYLDTQHNSVEVALANLYASFVISGMKMYRYMRLLSVRAQPTQEVVIRIIRDLTYLANRLILGRRQEKVNSAAICSAQPSEVEYLAAAAFQAVLGRKQTRYAAVLRWLQGFIRETHPKSTATAARLVSVVRRGNAVYDKWKF